VPEISRCSQARHLPLWNLTPGDGLHSRQLRRVADGHNIRHSAAASRPGSSATHTMKTAGIPVKNLGTRTRLIAQLNQSIEHLV